MTDLDISDMCNHSTSWYCLHSRKGDQLSLQRMTNWRHLNPKTSEIAVTKFTWVITLAISPVCQNSKQSPSANINLFLFLVILFATPIFVHSADFYAV